MRLLPTLLLFLPLVGCDLSGQGKAMAGAAGGNAAEGVALIRSYGCGTCHSIPGVRGADAMVGPPLISWSSRRYIAGLLPNTPENLVAWISSPQPFEPGTAMPDLGVSDEEARHITAYLFTIR